MSKYVCGIWITTVCTGLLVGINVGAFSGLLASFIVLGITQAITGAYETFIAVVSAAK